MRIFGYCWRVMAIPLGTLLSALGLLGCSGQDLLNGLTPSSASDQIRDLEYAPDQAQALDIYRPTPSARSSPVVVFFYGGRWSTGDKAGYRFLGQALAARGIMVVIPNYRLYPAVRFPAFVEDGAQAVAWTHRRIAEFGGDPSRLFVMGHSAGAHIAAMLALDAKFLANTDGGRDALRGMIGLSGPYDFLPLTDADLQDIFGPPSRYPLSQPIHFVDGRNPPLLLLHGEDDTNVKVRNTRSLARAVAAAGGPVTSVIYPHMSPTRMIANVCMPLGWPADVLERIQQFVAEPAQRAESSRVSSAR
jgi:acetyl esterase/lipase